MFNNPVSVRELSQATHYWIKLVQRDVWYSEIDAIKKGSKLKRTSCILSLDPFLNESEMLRAGGRQKNAKLSFDNRHHIILPANHQLVKLLIRTEHLRLLHTGNLLTSASLSLDNTTLLVITRQSRQSHAVVLFAGNAQLSQTLSSWDNFPRNVSHLTQSSTTSV